MQSFTDPAARTRRPPERSVRRFTKKQKITDITTMKFKEYKGLDLPPRPDEVLKQWDAHGHVPQEHHQPARDIPSFVFYEGPPRPTELPVHPPVIARTIKDLICRYARTRGFLCTAKGGMGHATAWPVEPAWRRSSASPRRHRPARSPSGVTTARAAKPSWSSRAYGRTSRRRMGNCVNHGGSVRHLRQTSTSKKTLLAGCCASSTTRGLPHKG